MKVRNWPLVCVGIILIIGQLVSLIGLSCADVGLYPSSKNLMRPIYSQRSALNMEQSLFAITAGGDRLNSGITDLVSSNSEYPTPTSVQYASAAIRESLGCDNGGSVGLVIYDTILTISYFLVGIVGLLMLYFGTKPVKK